MLTGQNGILTQAQRAKNETENAQADEENTLANYESYLNSYSGENTEFTDSLGNKVIVPAGFRVVNPGDNVEDGIVIEDVTHGATVGSQFVWIPVGDVKKEDGSTINIKLSRYTFDTITGETSNQGSSEIQDNYIELNEGNSGNIPARENIESENEGFRKSAIDNGGYYIGRYEARNEVKRSTTTEDADLKPMTLKANDYVYNYVTQKQAANLSRNMYNDSNFKSDLMNSYAWDTAIVFLQECDDRDGENNKPYSQQNSLNMWNLATQGTNNTETKDQICNIFDMGGNCVEWTTETSNNADTPCVYRGGNSNNSNDYTANRHADSTTAGNGSTYSFRPILYL